MMILFDGVHMTSDESLEELYEAAKAYGLRRRWLQRSNGGVLHFDLFGSKAKLLKANCEGRDIVTRGIRGKLPWTNGRQHRSMQAGEAHAKRVNAAQDRRERAFRRVAEKQPVFDVGANIAAHAARRAASK